MFFVVSAEMMDANNVEDKVVGIAEVEVEVEDVAVVVVVVVEEVVHLVVQDLVLQDHEDMVIKVEVDMEEVVWEAVCVVVVADAEVEEVVVVDALQEVFEWADIKVCEFESSNVENFFLVFVVWCRWLWCPTTWLWWLSTRTIWL